MTIPQSPSPQGISTLLRKAGFTNARNSYSVTVTSGYLVSRDLDHAGVIRVRFYARSSGVNSSPEYVKGKLAQYAEAIDAAGWTVEASEYELVVTGKAAQ